MNWLMLLRVTFLSMLLGCGDAVTSSSNSISLNENSVKEINTLPGFNRISIDKESFGDWLRNLKLKKDKRVRLFDGRLKSNQQVQYAVLDIKTGKKDLQQCADAIIRLRSEYLLARGDVEAIAFLSTSMQELSFSKWCAGWRHRLKGNRLEAYLTENKSKPTPANLDIWLEFVYLYCGTYSLQQQLKPASSSASLQPGDVIVEGGFPGHAMIVMDVSKNENGEEAFLLAQSYMPAQDMHLVVNPQVSEHSPWYLRNSQTGLITPEWNFKEMKFYRW